MRHAGGIISLVGILLIAAAPEQPGSRPEGLQQCLAAAAERENFSGAILVSRADHVVASVYRGRLAGPDSQPIGPETRFNLGSVSKMFTAVAIGQLIEAKKLRLDQPIGQVVPGLTRAAAAVTIRQLLTHSSGLGDFFRPENMSAMMRARTASDILPLIAGEVPAFLPGAKFAYSNSGFALLGVAIERASGLTYGDYLERNIFIPAGMTSTGLDPRPLSTLAVAMTQGGMRPAAIPGAGPLLIGPDGKPNSARPGPADGRKMVLIGPDGRPIDPTAVGSADHSLRAAPGATEGFGSPAGGLFGTAEDLRRFAASLLQNKLLSPAMTDAFTSPQIESAAASAQGPARHYGFGFGITEEGGKRWIGHNGGTLGANAEFAVDPQARWVITILSNRDPPIATNLMRLTREWVGRQGGLSCAA